MLSHCHDHHIDMTSEVAEALSNGTNKIIQTRKIEVAVGLC